MKPAALIIASEQAGGTGDDSLAEAEQALSDGFAVELVRTSDEAGLQAALDSLAGRLLVVAGGDGSLHTVVAALHARRQLAQTDLALVPLGTGNDFAQTMEIPLDPAEAAALIADAVRRPLDLVVDDGGGVVVNVVHGGVGADAAERAAGWKPALGAAAYPLGALIAAATADGWVVTVELDGQVLHADAPVLMVAVCNGRSIGGGTALCPTADPADGLLDVVLVTAVDVGARVGFGNDLRKGQHLDRDDVSHFRGVSVRISGEPLGYDADGEISQPVASRTFTLQTAAWTLRVPRAAPIPLAGRG